MTRLVLVTGATGFVGRAVVEALAAAGWGVRAAVRESRATDAFPATIERAETGDLAAVVDWPRLIDGADAVVHLAGMAHQRAELPEELYLRVNAWQTGELARAAAQAGVSRIVFASSVRAQTGPVATGVLTEDRPPIPTDAYGRSKLAAECALTESLDTTTTDWTILRPVVVYGPGVKANLRALQRLAASPWPLPLGGLSGRRSLLALDALVRAITHGLTSPATARGTFLVADRTPVTVPGIIAAMRRGLRRGPGIWPCPQTLAAMAARLAGKAAAWQRLTSDLIASSERLAATGWAPTSDTQAAIERWIRSEIAASPHR